MDKPKDLNKLANEKSLYLKQHAHQKIAWYPWGDEAIEHSKKENLPIFLSIGYSSCHWCHVMSEKTFDGPQVAETLNKNFICIKVDREEHPDVDQFFQKLAREMSNQGGWPLSFFLTPKLEPILCGTYFPLGADGDYPGFIGLCEGVSETFKSEKGQIEKRAKPIKEALLSNPQPDPENHIEFPGHFPSAHSILNALEPYKDEKYGGYGEAPKFPSYPFFEWAIEQVIEGVVPKETTEHIIKSIEAMASGGIADQVRGGVHRYSTDEKWQVPHFEKMLYDQAGFLSVLVKASLVYPSPLFFDSIIMTLEYLQSEMLSEEGYFFSAQDAESEGVEGLYFTFTEEEFEDALSRFDDTELGDNIDRLKKWMGVNPLGNFENGLNILSIKREFFSDVITPENWELIRKAKAALFHARSQRVPPTTDTKGLASWNFMILSSLCDLVQYSKIEIITTMATQLINSCLDGIHKTFLTEDDKSLKITHSTTQSESLSYLEDYATFAHAHSRLFEITGKKQFKKNVIQSLNFIKKNFFDGNFFKTRNLSETAFYENIHYPLFDLSFRSSSATTLKLLRKWSLEQVDLFSPDIQGLYDKTKQFTLTNPIVFGECLRSLIYPDEALKKIDIPKSWLKNSNFTSMRAFFSERFLLNYIDESSWQICNKFECEATGEDFESFQKFLEAGEPKEED